MVWPVVEYTASWTEEHAPIGVVDEDELVYIARSRYTPFNSTSVWFGEQVPTFYTAEGRLWLASLPEAECEAALRRTTRERRTPYTATDVTSLMEKIAQVRHQDYAVTEQEFEIGMPMPVVPLTDREGAWWSMLSLTSRQPRTSLEALCHDHLDLLYNAQAVLAS